ncbi:MAG: CPBP family intramembrane glutamic endopeptidase [Promethearchaeota archaeon]
MSFKSVLKDIFLNHDEDRRRKGDDLGIFITLNAIIFIIIFSNLFDTDRIRSYNQFYLLFDIIFILFIFVFFLEKKLREEKVKFIEFPDFESSFYMLIFVFVIFLIYVGINRIIEPFMYDSSEPLNFTSRMTLFNTMDIFQLVRVVPFEEIVFRGFGMFAIGYFLTDTFNKDKTSENFERNEKAIWYFAIIVTGILFGLCHIPKYLENEHFPYFIFYIGGQPRLVHIFFPIFILSIFGLLLGLCQYKFGLTAAIILHTANNYFADAVIYSLILFVGGF